MDNGLQGELTEDATLHISESSPSLHYGQQAFEGLKAYRTKDGSIQLFRPDENAKRLQRTCDRLLMPQVPTEMFVEACKQLFVRMKNMYLHMELVEPLSSSSFDWCWRYHWGKTSRGSIFSPSLLCQLEITLRVDWFQQTS